MALIWNDRRDEANALMPAYEGFLQRHGTDYSRVGRRPAEGVLDRFFEPGGCELVVLENRQSFNYEGLKGRVLSCSYMPDEADPGFAPMLEALELLFTKHEQSGRVEFVYDCHLYFGSPGVRQP